MRFIKNLIQENFRVDLNKRVNYRYALMFYYDLWQRELGYFGFKSLDEALITINYYQDIVEELKEIINCLQAKLKHETKPLQLEMPNVLELHAQYSRDEIIAAFEKSTPEKRFPSQEGVVPLEEHNAELLFVTLNKTEKDFSPTTQYEDYAINEWLFHWQSQNSASEDTKKGKSYIFQEDYGKTILLFVREKKRDAYRMTEPYYFLGPVYYQEHKGAKPMSIKWKLEESMPPYLVKSAVKMGEG